MSPAQGRLLLYSTTALPISRPRIFSSRCRSFRSLHPQKEKQTKQPIPPPPSALEGAPRSHGQKVFEFTPKALDRPIGLPNPPKPGENSGIDRRTWRQKFNDYFDRDIHREKHEKLVAALAKPYFREYNNVVKHHEGKSFLSPPRIFKSERALYFPNLYGQTLLKVKKHKHQDTTPLFRNKVSVVSIYSNQWAEDQTKSLVAQKNNPELHETVDQNSDVAQFVNLNMQGNSVKAWIIRLFLGRLRKEMGEKNWGRYFLVTRTPDVETGDAMGLLNNQVGYTYLLDGECKIRWACSGQANEDEKLGIVRGARLLIKERSKEEETILGKHQAGTERAASKNIKAALAA